MDSTSPRSRTGRRPGLGSAGHRALCQDVYDFLEIEHIETIVTLSSSCYLNRIEATRKEEFSGLSASKSDAA